MRPSWRIASSRDKPSFARSSNNAASAATVKTAPSAATAASPSLSTAPSTRDMSTNHKCIRDALSAYEVEVRSAAGRGRCVFAKGALGRGEVVLEARPMGCAVNDKYSELVCHYCFGLLPTIKAMQVKCSGGCGGVVYPRLREIRLIHFRRGLEIPHPTDQYFLLGRGRGLFTPD